MEEQKIYIFALAAQGEGISGSDRIFIEFARYWSEKYNIEIFVFKDGQRMCLRQGLNVPGIKFQVTRNVNILGFIGDYFFRIISGIKTGLTLKLANNSIIIYSASEFWMDSLPAFILKLRYPKIKWIAAWYQTAPSPLRGFSEDVNKARSRINALVYYLIQLPIRPMIKRFADFILVNNNNEKKQFPDPGKKNKTIAVDGAVDLERINKWKGKKREKQAVYDAVFQGRLHDQKGVMELIDIWKMVMQRKADTKLVMIGNGPLMKRVKAKIKDEGLEKNIRLTGYLFDGEEKYKILSQSKIAVHPSLYDSGGMAALEAMTFELPCIGFNLSSYKYYYPKGMLKVKIGNIKEFADKILQMLSDKRLYLRYQKQTKELISDYYSWKYRSRQILSQVLE